MYQTTIRAPDENGETSDGVNEEEAISRGYNKVKHKIYYDFWGPGMD